MTARMRTSLRLKLTLFVAAIVVLTAGALSVASYVFARRILRAQIHDRLSVVANDRQKLLLGYVQQQQERVALVASRTRLRQMIEQFGAGRLDAETFRTETRRILLDAQGSSPGLLAIWITDLNGRCITATGDEYLGKDFASTPVFVEGQKAARLRLMHDEAGRDRALLAAPARGADNRVVGIVMMEVDADRIMELLADRTGLGQTGVVLLGTRAGENIRYLLVPDAGTQSFDVPVSRSPTMAAATEGQSGFQQTIDWRGVPVLAAYRPVGYDDWGLVTKMDVAEAYAPIAWLRRLFITVESVVFVVGLLSSYLLARRFTRPILRMAGMAEAIAGGKLNARVVVEQQDEVGVLGRAFNHMTEELARSYGILEERVRERTAELAKANEELQVQIAERKRAEEELAQYFSLSLDLFCIADYRGGFKRLNPAWEQVLGYKLEELVAQPFLNFVHADDRPSTAAEFEKILKGGQTLQFENRYRCKNGAYKWLQWTAIPEPGQQIVHAVARDITEHKRAQELLAGFADALNRKNMNMQEDLKMAREIQQAFIPEHYPVLPRHAAPGESALRFVHLYQPAATLGGDFFDVFALSDTQVGVFICDVMGHGIRAALVTAIVRGLLEELRPFAADPGQFLTEINLGLIKNLKLATTTIFASAFYLVIDAATGEMLCANAGHPSPFWLRRDAGTVQLLPESDQARGPALGLMSETEYPTLRQRLGATDAVLLFTDGLYEVDDAEGNQFGLARLREEVQKRIRHKPGDLVNELVATVRKFSGSGEFSDDVCLVAVEAVESVVGDIWSKNARQPGGSALRADPEAV